MQIANTQWQILRGDCYETVNGNQVSSQQISCVKVDIIDVLL